MDTSRFLTNNAHKDIVALVDRVRQLEKENEELNKAKVAVCFYEYTYNGNYKHDVKFYKTEEQLLHKAKEYILSKFQDYKDAVECKRSLGTDKIKLELEIREKKEKLVSLKSRNLIERIFRKYE